MHNILLIFIRMCLTEVDKTQLRNTVTVNG